MPLWPTPKAAEHRTRRSPTTSIRPRRPSGSSRSTTCWRARARSACSSCSRRSKRRRFATASSCRSRRPRRTSTRSRADKQPPLSRQARARAADQELHPLERDGDGHAGQPRLSPASAGTSRRIASSAKLYEVASTTSSAAAARAATTATRFISRATRRPACTRGRFSKAGSPKQNLDQLPPRAAAEAAGCRRIRIPG